MGMFDSYLVSKDFKCPFCGKLFQKGHEFQSKDGECVLYCASLGKFINQQLRYQDYHSFCNNCKGLEFNCRVFIDSKGIAIKERITAIANFDAFFIYEAKYKKKGKHEKK